MGKVLEQISEREAAFIAASKVFFVGTAATSTEQHVNISPKAPGNSCVVLGPHEVAYADLTGSGAEAAAHVLQNGRMTIMFVNLERGPPKILRLHGKATLILAENVPTDLKARFPKSVTTSNGFRAVFKLKVHRVSTSCGYSMPQMDFVKYRNTLEEYVVKEGKDGMHAYCTKKNSFSIDGLPSLALLRETGPKHVEPVAEDGYVFGKACDEASAKTAMEEARKMHKMMASRSSKLEVGWPLAAISLMGAFAAGVVVGPLIAGW
eukprot:CAMPEP_0194036626 /NCGR_PEP_ID=MMETSP0009_2-20130614/8991_1 /TAXON_ID=210454 /ORGANISM="Grammatophora oceanica, Strain CCMP 410" /LENGTH=263 /DNA_ID=CAMNT_0038678461 /DNA_START=77 /DNA_END=865 /DNA_ORIENTATION=+